MYYLVAGAWADFSPLTIFHTDGSFVQTARIIIGFNQRLLLLNTVEQSADGTTIQQFVNRCRYSFAGSPFAVNAWLEPNNTNGGESWGGGGFVDATTAEAIIGVEFIKNHLIVFFESSTWEIVDTGNPNDPFLWQRLNVELGSESTFSTVAFDKVALATGGTGIHACNGSNVERIDNKIPDKIFGINDSSTGVARIWGIRDYFTEMVYWCMPVNSQPSNQPYPSSVLIYNYKNNSWALNDDCITAFGYFQQQLALQLQFWDIELQESHWELGGGDVAGNVRQVIAGNQQGFVYLVQSDVSVNCSARQITNIVITAGGNGATFTVIDHMLGVGNYISLIGIVGITNMNGNIYSVVTTPTANTFTIQNTNLPLTLWTGVYQGGGTLAFTSNIQVVSKQWNPYVTQDRNIFLSKIDFSVKSTESGQVTVDYLVGSGEQLQINQARQSGTLIGTGVLETFPYPSVPSETGQDRLWHPVYFQGDAQCIQIVINMTDVQIRNPDISEEDIQIEAMTLYTMPTSSRLT